MYLDECGFFCWTLEDEDRGLSQDMPLAQIKARKKFADTLPPTVFPALSRTSLKFSPQA
jgi:hypothetical protein